MRKIFKAEVLERLSSFGTLNVAIHDYAFHADDLFSIALLEELCEESKCRLNVLRTRNAELLAKADMRVDVGGRFSIETLDFDHHQNDQALMQKNGIKHSAFGLICQWAMTGVFHEIYREKFVLGIEAQDNTGKNHPSYLGVGFMVQSFLPAYGTNENFDEMFELARAVVRTVFKRTLVATQGFLAAEEDAKASIVSEEADGQIVVMNKRVTILPFLHPGWKFVVSPDPTGGWSFLGLNGNVVPERYRGLNSTSLAELGLKGKFVHVSGFTGSLENQTDVINICREAI